MGVPADQRDSPADHWHRRAAMAMTGARSREMALVRRYGGSPNRASLPGARVTRPGGPGFPSPRLGGWADYGDSDLVFRADRDGPRLGWADSARKNLAGRNPGPTLQCKIKNCALFIDSRKYPGNTLPIIRAEVGKLAGQLEGDFELIKARRTLTGQVHA